MESALRPREIQTRIRAGESVDDVARAAGVPVERIEPYAGPVLAEREHIAAQAQRGSVRRRGETAGHRMLRTAVAERLCRPGASTRRPCAGIRLRMEDGRWSVSASYASGEATREAVFYLRPQGPVLGGRRTTRPAGCSVSSPPPTARNPADGVRRVAGTLMETDPQTPTAS